MNALVLRDVQRFSLEDLPNPTARRSWVLLRVAAVGVCGTDFHIHNGTANYDLDETGRPIPLSVSPQILGHEFAATVESVGENVTRCKPGDRGIVDQVLSCVSQDRSGPCEYCETGDSHQCEFAQECGITGIPGAFAELIAVPEVNLVQVPSSVSFLAAMLTEPLGCIIHAHDRAQRTTTRYQWEGEHRIRTIVILGSGPSGLLFVEYLREVQKFDGEIIVVDQREAKLEVARRLGAITVDSRYKDPAEEVGRLTKGTGVQYLIEATGNGGALDWIPKLMRKQATLLLYGAGHANLSPGCLTPWQSMELSVVTSAGASGLLDKQAGPQLYRRTLDLIRDGKLHPERVVSHRYKSLAELPDAFKRDYYREDFIKAALVATQRSVN
jgi:L-iditol 2-dehydrogenase